MKIRDALLIEGTSNLGILCYGVFDAAHLDDAAVTFNQITDSDISEVHPLIDEGWPNALLLNEIIVSNADDIDKIVSKAFGQMMAHLRAMRMFLDQMQHHKPMLFAFPEKSLFLHQTRKRWSQRIGCQ
jgi:hypothetical protein